MNKKYLFEKLFLEIEDGEQPLLNGDDEVNMAAKVYNIATNEFVDDEDDSDTDSVLSFEEKVEAARSNLKHVSSLFSKTNSARRRFLRRFPAFKIRRTRTVGQLRNIADSIHADRFNGNISKIVGGCTGAVGAGVLITALAAPIAAPVVIPLAIAGGVASFLGGGVVFGTTATEIGLLRSKMSKATESIEDDRDAFESMEHWFKHTEALMKAIEDVVGFSVMKKLQEDVKEFVRSVKDLKGGKEYNIKFRNLAEGSVKQMCANGAIKAKFGVDLAPIVITFVFVVCLMTPRNRFVFECLVITHRLGLGLLGLLDVGVELGRLVAGLVMRGGAAAAEIIPQAAARVWALGAFAGVGLVIDVANVAIASIDLHNGSRSQQAEAVRKAALELERECRFLEEVNDEISAAQP